jgi:alkylation response protein AidB-like acyl-CoA dehydrogenase
VHRRRPGLSIQSRIVKREIFDPEHLAFRDTVKQFLTRHVLPHHASWEQAGVVDRWVWKAAADQGLLGLQAEEQYGCSGIAVSAVAASEAAYEMTLQYSKARTAFGQPIGRFQHSKFTLAEIATEVQIARVFVDRCVQLHVRGELTAVEAAMAKWWTTELHKKVVDACVQLHGGYGYMLEYPIAKAYIDTRVETIFGGTTEIMKEIIGRSLGL